MAGLDHTPPAALAQITGAWDDVGASQGLITVGGTSTDDVSPQIRGDLTTSLAANETVLVSRDGVVLGQANVAGTTWTFQDANVATGAHIWTASAVDAAGNASTASAPFSLAVSGPNLVYGKVGGDTVVGGAGVDKIWGVSAAASDLGKGAVDTLTGGASGDTFVLGDGRGRFYDDNAKLNAGAGDYARITDFSTAQGDKIQVAGTSSDYLLHATSIGGVSGMGVYYDTNDNGSWNSRDELIGFLPGNTTLKLSDFIFV